MELEKFVKAVDPLLGNNLKVLGGAADVFQGSLLGKNIEVLGGSGETCWPSISFSKYFLIYHAALIVR